MPRKINYTLPERAVLGAAVVMFIIMIVLTISQVIFRYVLQIPVPWTEEAARVLFILAVLSGFAFAYREDEHIFVDFLFDQYPEKLKRIVSILFKLSILGFLAFWLRGTWQLISVNWNNELITIPWFRVAYLYIWEFIMLLLLGVYIVIDLKKLILNKYALSQGNNSEGETDL